MSYTYVKRFDTLGFEVRHVTTAGSMSATLGDGARREETSVISTK